METPGSGLRRAVIAAITIGAFVLLDRQEDLAFTPKRHASWTCIKAGVKRDGTLTALHFLHRGFLAEMLQQTLLDPFIGVATVRDCSCMSGTFWSMNSTPSPVLLSSISVA